MGEKHQFVGPRDYTKDIVRSQDYGTVLPGERSAIRHRLMDQASSNDDLGLWHEIAQALVRASLGDDLTPEVSDHFVRDCPDEVFMVVKDAKPRRRFTRWHHRARRLEKEDNFSRDEG